MWRGVYFFELTETCGKRASQFSPKYFSKFVNMVENCSKQNGLWGDLELIALLKIERAIVQNSNEARVQ